MLYEIGMFLLCPVCPAPGGGDPDRREDPEEGGGVCGQPPHHHGHSGRLPCPGSTQVRPTCRGWGFRGHVCSGWGCRGISGGVVVNVFVVGVV